MLDIKCVGLKYWILQINGEGLSVSAAAVAAAEDCGASNGEQALKSKMPESSHLLRGLNSFLACADVAGGDNKNPALQPLPESMQDQAAAALALPPEVRCCHLLQHRHRDRPCIKITIDHLDAHEAGVPLAPGQRT